MLSISEKAFFNTIDRPQTLKNWQNSYRDTLAIDLMIFYIYSAQASMLGYALSSFYALVGKPNVSIGIAWRFH